VQGLAAAESGGKRLNRHADDVVFRLLRRERRARRLRVEAQHQRAWILCAEAFRHDVRPEPSRRAVLRDLLQQIIVRIKEKRKLRRKFIHAEPGVECRLNVSDAIGKRERNFLDGGRAGFADVIAGNRNGIPLGEVLAGTKRKYP